MIFKALRCDPKEEALLAASAEDAKAAVRLRETKDGASAPKPSQLSKMNLAQLRAVALQEGICLEHLPKGTKKQLSAAVRDAREGRRGAVAG